MIPTLGHLAVVIGLGATLYGACAFIVGGRSGDLTVLASARRAIYAAFALVAFACLAMVASLLSHDFSVLYVARNNATTTPLFYSVISLWAALEGSILFWTLLATGWASLVLYRYRNRLPALMPWVGATLALGIAFFFAVMAWAMPSMTPTRSRLVPTHCKHAAPMGRRRTRPRPSTASCPRPPGCSRARRPPTW